MSRSVLRAAWLAAAPVCACVLSWLPACLPITAAAAPLTLDDALTRAVQVAPATRAARAGLAGAQQAMQASGQLPDPMLSAGIDNLPVTGPDRFSTSREFMTMKRIGISQEWVSAEKRALQRAAAQAVTEREAVAEQVAAADARLQTALAYVDAWYAGEQGQLARAAEHHAQEEQATGLARLAAASGGTNTSTTSTTSSADVLGLTRAIGLAEDDRSEVSQLQHSALAALQRWTGLANGEVASDDLAPPVLAEAPNERDFVARHPAVVVRVREAEVARQDAALMAGNRTPNWTWALSYGQRSGNSDLLSFGVSIPWPASPSTRQDRDTAARLARVDQAEAELADAQRLAAIEHATLSSDAQRLHARIERYDAAVLAPTRQRTAATLAAYRANQASLSMLFEARHAEVEAQRKRLALQRELARAQAQLAYRPIVTNGPPSPIARPDPTDSPSTVSPAATGAAP